MSQPLLLSFRTQRQRLGNFLLTYDVFFVIMNKKESFCLFKLPKIKKFQKKCNLEG